MGFSKNKFIKNKKILKPVIKWLLSRYVLRYLLDIASLKNSENRFSKAVLVMATKRKDTKKSPIIQSLFSVVRKCKIDKIINAKLVNFISVHYYNFIKIKRLKKYYFYKKLFFL